MTTRLLSQLSILRLSDLDDHLLNPGERPHLRGPSRSLIEFLYFGIKEARACLFVGLFFAAVFAVPRAGIGGLPRYDVLLIIALAIQGWMVWAKLETLDELKAITLFHVIGFALEVFKTSSGIKSWAYPDFAYTKLFGVPLFSGFMYAAVGSYIIQAWRLFQLRVIQHPPHWMAAVIALLIYANFFSHHYIGDYRWYLVACALGLYARSTVIFALWIVIGRCPYCFRSYSSVFSSGLPRTSVPSSESGSIPTKWAPGPRSISENGVPGRCSS